MLWDHLVEEVHGEVAADPAVREPQPLWHMPLRRGTVQVLVDPQSAMYLQGATVDWQEGLSGAGFVVRNPNASGSCGCGMSFSV